MNGLNRTICVGLMLSSLLVGGQVLAADGEREVAAEINKANGLLRSGDVDGAVKAYQQVQGGAADRADLSYNMAVAQYRKGDMAAAEQLFDQASASENDALAAKARYNLGNCNYAAALRAAEKDHPAAIRGLEKAIENYRSALDVNSNDADSRANIELASAMIDKLREQDQKEQQKQQDRKQNDEKQQQDQKDQQNKDQKDQKQENSKQQEKKDSQQQDKDQQQSKQNEQQKPDSSKEKKENKSQGQQGSKDEQQKKDEESKDKSGDKQNSKSQEQKPQPQESKSDQKDSKDQSQDSKSQSQEQKKDNSADQKQQSKSDKQSQEEKDKSQADSADEKQGDQSKQQQRQPQASAKQNSKNQRPEKDEAKQSDQAKDQQGSAAPKGELSAADKKAGKADPQGKEMAGKPEVVKEGEMTVQEAEKMLQAIRDQEMLRRLKRQATERNQHVPVDRDW